MINGLDPLTTSLTSSSSIKFQVPAKLHIKKLNGGKLNRAYVSCTSSSNQDSYFDQHNMNRRGLIFTATLPFIFGVHESIGRLDANAIVAYSTIQEGVKKVLTKQKAAGLLRLVFHDAGTFDATDNSGGMNGSIVYELERPENAGLKKSVKILEKVKNELDERENVSWADVIAVAGAEAVSLCGGPVIPIRLGRVDSTVPDPEGKLPEESLDASGLKQSFRQKGFSTQELVALSGAHTLGNKGFGSPVTFDNSYFKILLEKPWLPSTDSMIGLPSDRALPEDDECLRWIRTYADDQKSFFDDFTNAYIKLVDSGASWKNA
ncbi:L-ascorbate peroxidase [Ranunculus cassubicifolius]